MMIPANPYRGFRYPAEVIQHAVWLYHCLSYDVSAPFCECGVPPASCEFAGGGRGRVDITAGRDGPS
jgi:hypothetical protein